MSEQLVAKTIYIIRHGQTIGNTDKILYEPNHDVLNDVGKLEASFQGKRLKDVHFDRVVTSEYPRTIETASIILSHNEKNKSPSSREDTRLREIDFYNMYGSPYKDILQALIVFLKSEKPIEEFQSNGSEPIPEIRKRVKTFVSDLIQEIFSNDKEETVMVVSHGACIRFLVESFANEEEFETEDWDNDFGLKIMRNTSCHKLRVTKSNGSDKEIKPRVKFEELHNCSHIPKHMLENDALTRMAETPEGKCLSGCLQV